MLAKALAVKVGLLLAFAAAGLGTTPFGMERPGGLASVSASPAETSSPSLAASRPVDTRAGNLLVVVPVLPDLHHLRSLCRSFRTGHHSSAISQLIGATGGSAPRTGAWCQDYLHRGD